VAVTLFFPLWPIRPGLRATWS